MILAVHIKNHLLDEADGRTHIEKSSQVEVQAKMQYFHTLDVQNMHLHQKLKMLRQRNGLQGQASPMLAGSASLVLSLDTGLTSPRFSVVHDDFFETTYNLCST